MARQSTAEEIDARLAEDDASRDVFESPMVPLVGVLNGLAFSILLWYGIGLLVAFLGS